jgi:hypothetical protein
MSLALPLRFGGVAYDELHHGSGQIKLGSNQGAVRRLVCAWTDAVKLGMLLRGWTQVTANTWRPSTPQAHPAGIGMYCTDVSVSPIGKPSGENTWQYAALAAEYKTVLRNLYIGPGQQESYDLLDEELDFSADVAALGKTGWTYDDDSSPVQTDV